MDTKFVAAQNGILYPRAGALGGCSAHNAMITVYPCNSDWNGLRELTGDESWSADHMHTYFKRLEHCDYVAGLERVAEAIAGEFHGEGLNPSGHGYSGWLHTQTANPELIFKDFELLRLVTRAAVSGLANHLGCLETDIDTLFDPNDWRTITSKGREGVSLTPLATHNGARIGVRERLLDTVKETKGRLKIQTGALATRIVFDGTRAVAVEYLGGSNLYRASRNPAADAAARSFLPAARSTARNC